MKNLVIGFGLFWNIISVCDILSMTLLPWAHDSQDQQGLGLGWQTETIGLMAPKETNCICIMYISKPSILLPFIYELCHISIRNPWRFQEFTSRCVINPAFFLCFEWTIVRITFSVMNFLLRIIKNQPPNQKVPVWYNSVYKYFSFNLLTMHALVSQYFH